MGCRVKLLLEALKNSIPNSNKLQSYTITMVNTHRKKKNINNTNNNNHHHFHYYHRRNNNNHKCCFMFNL